MHSFARDAKDLTGHFSVQSVLSAMLCIEGRHGWDPVKNRMLRRIAHAL